MNMATLLETKRVYNPCPTDGHYTYASFTRDCFRGDWITLNEDHTPGDKDGRMLLINSSYHRGEFFNTNLSGLKAGAPYEFSVWMLNVCRPSDKCPFPLLPNITIQVMSSSQKLVFELNTGNLPRSGEPTWNKFNIMFTMPKGENNLFITMINNSPGGCGNDFAVDDIAFRECVITPPPVTKKTPSPAPKKTAPIANRNVKKIPSLATPPSAKKPVPTATAKKTTPKPKTKTVPPSTVDQKKSPASKPAEVTRASKDDIQKTQTRINPPPSSIASRSNPIVKKFETGPGEIKIELFDNGEIDGDTVTIYHNNSPVLSRVRLSAKALIFTITIDANQPHHELVMVAENLGSIPPNTSLMYVTAESKRHEVFISSDKQKNARIIFDLKKE